MTLLSVWPASDQLKPQHQMDAYDTMLSPMDRLDNAEYLFFTIAQLNHKLS
ncbi:hypothetical protein BJB45_11485 [Halomonas huangheensis]|uniref:Uncharacterized protein n=1 Tax=Halomonas huangheensis TaxID=1178482 RepID=W1NA17_9GAMM|nr:hypothetical protein BJB45_11485 [Halomonas huangheensis]